MSDDLVFADDGNETESQGATHSWRVLIVDDEPEIHNVTKLALDDFNFLGRSIEYLHAYSGKEARELLSNEKDIAIILLDVVMETDHEGLDVTRFIREELKNDLVRIILRTGQPGQAPPLEVIKEYDINDYKEKSELTAEKLICTVYTGLSAYRDLTALDANRRGLEKVIEASAEIFRKRNLDDFAAGVLEQLTALLYLNHDALLVRTSGIAAEETEGRLRVFAGTGKYHGSIGKDVHNSFHDTIRKRIETAMATRHSIIDDEFFAGYYTSGGERGIVLYVSGTEPLASPDRRLLELFCRNVSIAQLNLELSKDVEEAQQEVVFVLSEAIEKRSKETGNHVRRVGAISRMLALAYGLDEQESELLAIASPLHDAGKIGIPDAILNKAGTHTDEERAIMKDHAKIGYDILKGHERPVLKTAAIVAGQHHEKWDGSGYPRGLSGEDIHIYGRIVALADVFDALSSSRCYKDAWPMDEVIDFVKHEAGTSFEPKLVDLLLDNFEQVKKIRAQFQDAA